MSVYKVIATVAFVLLLAGWWKRKSRDAHIRLVMAGILLDLGMVVWLEVERSVIAAAAGAKSYDGLEIAHIVTSSIAVALYFPTMYFGSKLMRGDGSVRAKHKWVANAALVFRTLGFALMWSV